MNCKNCGASCDRPAMAQIWREIRVGGMNSPDRFHLCPSCKDEVDPIDVWARDAELQMVPA